VEVQLELMMDCVGEEAGDGEGVNACVFGGL